MKIAAPILPATSRRPSFPGNQRPSAGTPTRQEAYWSRRRFLQAAALAGAAGPFFLSRSQAGVSANGKLNHACIGVGGMGWNDLHSILSHKQVQIVALCDVDANTLARAAKEVPGARLYSDWRELLAKEENQVDSVNAAVPDHTHFSIAYSAVGKGKHVYCQKPLCHDVLEVRALTELAANKGVVTQLGTQFASSIHERTAVQWLKEGRIGQVQHAYLCSNRPGAVENYRLKGPRPATGQECPKHLDWELWLGSAPVRPYAPDIYHPTKWRAWQDFGTGWSGDIGCHIFSGVWKGLGLEAPLTVRAEVQESWQNSPERRADTWPQGDHITWTFPANDKTQGNALPVEWADGEFYPPAEVRRRYSEDLKEYPAESAMVLGTEGALLLALDVPPQLLPEEKFKDLKRPKLPPRDHYHHFVDACLGGEKTESHFALTGPMAEAVLLGTVAIRLPGQVLHWDPRALSIKNHPEADHLLRRTYRDGWHVGQF
jgi:predicted dehydrogenase